MRIIRNLLFTAVAVLLTSSPAEATQRLLWTENFHTQSKIQSANLDGSNVVQILGDNEAPFPAGLAADFRLGKMYWVGTQDMYQANLDGTSIQKIVTGPVKFGGVNYNPRQIALDPDHGELYWTGSSTANSPFPSPNDHSSIFRSNLDGSALVQLFTSNQVHGPSGIALDLAHQRIYFCDFTSGSVDRINMDGTGFEVLFSDPFSAPRGIALDVAHDLMYFTSQSNHRGVYRAHLDGSQPQQFFDDAYPNNIALDLGAGKMYLTGGAVLVRANLDGSNLEIVLDDLQSTWGIAIVPEPSSVVLAAIGLMGLAAWGWRRKRAR